VKTQAEVRADALATAKQIITATSLTAIDATYGLESCNDQGDPPIRSVVTFLFSQGVSYAAIVKQVADIADTLKSTGWSTQGAGISHANVSLTKNGYLLQISADPNGADPAHPTSSGDTYLYGPCSDISGLSSAQDILQVPDEDVTSLLR
jgi:hypothetical protein